MDLDSAEKRTDRALHNLLDSPRPTIAGIARELHAQAISMHHAAHFRRRDKNTVLQTLYTEETIASAIGAHGSFNRAAWLG
jgi:hypothetical protein